MKITASEAVTKAGYKPEDTIGKVSVSVGGVSVNKADHVINVQKATEVTVKVAGDEAKTIQLTAE